MPKNLRGGAATKVVNTLVANGLVKEVRAKPDMPAWRRDEAEAQSYALIATRAGLKAINIDDETAGRSDDAPTTKAREKSAPKTNDYCPERWSTARRLKTRPGDRDARSPHRSENRCARRGDWMAAAHKEFDAGVLVKEGDQKRTLAKAEVMLRSVVNKALKGDPKAICRILKLLETLKMLAPIERGKPENGLRLIGKAEYEQRHGTPAPPEWDDLWLED